MSAFGGESSAEKAYGNSTIPKSEKPLDWYIPWTEYGVQQAQVAQRTIRSTIDKAIDVTRSRVDRFLITSSAHFNQTIDSLKDLKSEYITYDDIVFGKIKEGFLYGSSRPLITTGAILGVGFLGLKRTRQILSYNTRRLFFSEETLLSRADAKVKELRQSIQVLKTESQELEKKASEAEGELVRGRMKFRQAGKQIQGVINSAYKIESQASGLKDVLGELPSREASRFQKQVKNLVKEVKRERNAMSMEVTKINNYGISV